MNDISPVAHVQGDASPGAPSLLHTLPRALRRRHRPQVPSWSRPRPPAAPQITSSLEHQLDET